MGWRAWRYLDSEKESWMTYNDGVKIVSRALAVYFVAAALGLLIDLPHTALNLVRDIGMAREINPDAYFTQQVRESIFWFAEYVLRLAIWLALALWCYRCGPRIQKFFGCDVQEDITEPENGQ